MLISASTLPPGLDDAADILIVGAGAVGLAIGITLARRGVRVTILEAGPERPRADYRERNEGIATARPYRGILDGRMKALGGTTRLWGGQLVPFDEGDFLGDPEAGRSRWPIAYEEIAPFIARAFTFLGVEEEATDREAVWRAATQLPPEMGEHLRLGMNIWLPQADLARLFDRDIRELETLRIITEAEVSAIRFNDKGTRVTEVSAGSSGGRFAAPVMVLANGTLEIARLLLRTKACAPDCGFAGNPNIGCNFMDHLHGYGGEVTVTDARRAGDYFDHIYQGGRKYGVKIRPDVAFREQHHIANCAVSLVASASIGGMLADIKSLARRVITGRGFSQIGRAVTDSIAIARILVPLAWRYLKERRASSVFSRGVMLGVEIEQLRSARSYLALDPSMPPDRAPITVHWDIDGREIEAAALTCEEFAREFERLGLGRITLDPRLAARDPAVFDDFHDSFHQMGGACMADRAEDGVVDRDLKVFGTDNLYVLGAATFPSGSFANPTLTAIAFAMRLADHLEGRNGC